MLIFSFALGICYVVNYIQLICFAVDKSNDKEEKSNRNLNELKKLDSKPTLFNEETDLPFDFGDLATQPFPGNNYPVSEPSRSNTASRGTFYYITIM